MLRFVIPVIVGVAMLSVGGRDGQAQTPRDQLIMAWNVDQISTFDPAQIGEIVTDELIENICDTLVIQDVANEARILPWLASAWSVAEDGRSITFTLREGLRHPSGNPVTARDVEWSMKRVLELSFGNAATLTEYGFNRDNMNDAFVAVDDRTFRVNLQRPFPPEIILSAIMATRVGMVLDSVDLRRREQNNDRANRFLVNATSCIGPYRLRQWQAGESVVLEANPDHWAGAPRMRRIVIRQVPEASVQRLLLERGDIDIARDITTPGDIAAVRARPGLRIDSRLGNTTVRWTFSNGHPALQDPRVRRAFRYMIDYEGLANTVMRDVGVVRQSLLLQQSGVLTDAEANPYRLDLDRARALLTEAGHAQGLRLSLYIGSLPYAAPLAQHLQQNAARIGVELRIEQIAGAELSSRIRGRNFEVAMGTWRPAGPDPFHMMSRHATNPDNRAEARQTMFPTWTAGWFRADFNERVNAATFTTDPDRRRQMWRELALEHLQDGPFAYMFQLLDSIALRDSVVEFPWNPNRAYYARVVKR